MILLDEIFLATYLVAVNVGAFAENLLLPWQRTFECDPRFKLVGR